MELKFLYHGDPILAQISFNRTAYGIEMLFFIVNTPYIIDF